MIYPVDSAIQLLNNWGQEYKRVLYCNSGMEDGEIKKKLGQPLCVCLKEKLAKWEFKNGYLKYEFSNKR